MSTEMESSLSKNLQIAVAQLRKGLPILMLDDDKRENEGDLVVAAEKISPEIMNFLIKKGSGIVCLSATSELLSRLQIPMMVKKNTNQFETAFTVSIEAKSGISTGVSAKDRAHTIMVAVNDDTTPHDIAMPGHIFPLCARPNGVFDRLGHTEGSVDIMRLAGLKPAAAICELMNEDGSMTVGQDRLAFAKKHMIPIVTVEEILLHRIKTEKKS